MPYTDFREELIAGTSLPMRLSVTRGGAAVNITGWSSLAFIGKRSLADADADALFTLTTVAGLTVVSLSSGIVDATVPDETTLSILKTTRVWCGFRAVEAPDAWMPATGFVIVYPSVYRGA